MVQPVKKKGKKAFLSMKHISNKKMAFIVNSTDWD